MRYIAHLLFYVSETPKTMDIKIHFANSSEVVGIALSADDTVASVWERVRLSGVSGCRDDVLIMYQGVVLDRLCSDPVHTLGISQGDVLSVVLPAPLLAPHRYNTEGITAVSCIAIAPCCSQLLIASHSPHGGQIHVFNTENGCLEAQLDAETGHITGMAFSSSTLYSAGASGNIKLWGRGSWTEGSSVEAHKGVVQGIAVSKTRGVLYSHGSSDRMIKMWDVGMVCVRCHDIGWSAKGLAESACGRRVFVSSFNSVHILDAETLVALGVLRGHSNIISSLIVPEQGTAVYSCATDDTVRVWDAETRICLKVFCGHSKQVNCLCLLPRRQLLLSGGEDNTVRVWCLVSRKEVGILSEFSAGVIGIEVAPSEDVVFVCQRQKGANPPVVASFPVSDIKFQKKKKDRL